MALVTLLPESPERDNRELDLRQSVIGLLYITTGFAASETKDAIERAAALAEKAGNLTQLVNSVLWKGTTAGNPAGVVAARGSTARSATLSDG
jgi:hypothetical protein